MLWLHEYVSPYLRAGFGLSPVEIKEKKGDIDTVGLSENNFSVSQGKNLEKKKIYIEREKLEAEKLQEKLRNNLKYILSLFVLSIITFHTIDKSFKLVCNTKSNQSCEPEI